MSEKKFTDNDAYDELLKSFSSAGNTDTSDEIKNRGEIYFSMNSRSENTGSPVSSQTKSITPPTARTVQNSAMRSEYKSTVGTNAKNSASSSARHGGETKKSESASGTAARKSTNPKKASTGKNGNGMAQNRTKKKAKAKGKKQMSKVTVKNSIIAIVIVVAIFVSAVLIKIPIMGCINDILAIDVSSDEYRVTLDEDCDVNEVIDILAEKNLINNPMFCKIFARLMGHYEKTDFKNNVVKIVYPAGEYYLNSSMGLEGMLREIKTNGDDSNTVTLTFPEGYSVDQIVEKLDSNGVCSAESLYKVMLSDELYEKYDFLSKIEDKELRYRVLEGFLYPDTYEFYVGESPLSVLERFLKNFDEKWDDAYSARASELGYTVDEIITVASIIEKEASDAEQMSLVASVLYNRLKSSSFPKLECDSTQNYIEQHKELMSSSEYATYMKVYDTYQTTGLPEGPICCPGAEAIYSALYFENTNYYFFAHDNEGKIYLAETFSQHEVNNNEIDRVNSALAGN